MHSDNIWYFAYGSNLNIVQMKKRVGEWTNAKRAHLFGYRLVFNVKSRTWGGLTANIKETKANTDRVDGAVYLLTQKQLDALSTYERGELIDVMLKLEDNSELENVKAYIWDRPTLSETPPSAYLQTMLEGLKQHGYGKDVIERVEKIAKG